MLHRLATLTFASLLGISFAVAQTAPQTNPLRPSSTRTKATQQPAPAAAPSTAQPKAAAPAPAGSETKAARQRSPAQLANDNRMRQCGAEWRANKAALEKQGKTWRTYMPECNARLKAQGR